MRILLFSDVHHDLDAARRLVETARTVDVVIGAGDFAVKHEHLEETIDTLSAMDRPALLVPGNNETEDALRSACEAWPAAQVLHGSGAEIDGRSFFGLGGGIPPTPFDWSYDLEEDDARGMLVTCPPGAVLILHSPPQGELDGVDGRHAGSVAAREAIERCQPPLAVCGHIHDCWGEESRIGSTRLVNPGPQGQVVELP